MLFLLIMLAVQGGVVVSTAASHQAGSSLLANLGPYCAELACSPYSFLGFLWVLQFPESTKVQVQKQAFKTVSM